MTKDKTRGVVIRPSMYEALKALPDDERLRMYDAIVQYGIEKREPKLTGYLRSMWTLIKPIIDSSQSNYEKNQENGAKGGAPKGNQNARKHPKINPKTTENQPKNNHDIDIDIDTDTDTDIDTHTDTDTDTDTFTAAQTVDCAELRDRFFEMVNKAGPHLPTKEEAYAEALQKLDEKDLPF